MNKVSLYLNYAKNLILFSIKKIKYKEKFRFALKENIGNKSNIIIKGKGKLIIKEKVYTRSNFNVLVENGKCLIGERCFFNHNCSITCLEEIYIGDECKFGNNLVIVDHDHNINKLSKKKFLKSKVIINDGCWIGANVTILRGSVIGKNCVIAAGSIVNGVVPDNSIYVQKRKNTIIKNINIDKDGI
ncbi:acyltransferase [Clostridium perfringens]